MQDCKWQVVQLLQPLVILVWENKGIESTCAPLIYRYTEEICERFDTDSNQNGHINDLINSITQEMLRTSITNEMKSEIKKLWAQGQGYR